MHNSNVKKLNAIYLVIFIAVLGVFSLPPISQSLDYHNFSDQRQLLGIAHFWNVISNLPFIAVSFIAVNNLLNEGSLKYPKKLFLSYLVFFVGVGVIGIGSIYYHLQPKNETLLWDRLPMTIAFMAFMTVIIGEYISEKAVSTALIPLVLIGIISVIYWYITEQAGQGDLRPYALVQFLPIVIIPMVLLMFPSRYTHTIYLWGVLAVYVLAKVFELFDNNLFNLVGMGGHAIKHVISAIGPYLFFLALKKRECIGEK